MLYSKDLKFKKKSSVNIFIRWGIVITILIIIFFLFRNSVKKAAKDLPLVSVENVSNTLKSKKSLIAKIIELQTTINSYKTQIINSDMLRDENTKLKAELGRTPAPRGVLAHVRTLPNRSFYDTFLIDAGLNEGLTVGQVVYAFGSVALGIISDVAPHSATVLLYSESGRETPGTAVGSDTAVTLIGRGNGEYEVRMPRDVHFDVGGLIAYQSVESVMLAQIEKIATDPRDPFQRLLARAPVNLQALKWVMVK